MLVVHRHNRRRSGFQAFPTLLSREAKISQAATRTSTGAPDPQHAGTVPQCEAPAWAGSWAGAVRRRVSAVHARRSRRHAFVQTPMPHRAPPRRGRACPRGSPRTSASLVGTVPGSALRWSAWAIAVGPISRRNGARGIEEQPSQPSRISGRSMSCAAVSANGGHDDPGIEWARGPGAGVGSSCSIHRSASEWDRTSGRPVAFKAGEAARSSSPAVDDLSSFVLCESPTPPRDPCWSEFGPKRRQRDGGRAACACAVA